MSATRTKRTFWNTFPRVRDRNSNEDTEGQEPEAKEKPPKQKETGNQVQGEAPLVLQLQTIASRTSLSSSAQSAPFCRICHDDDTCEQLISPCHCKGSLNYCHPSCLRSWLTEKVHDLKEPSCEICKCAYEVRYERVGVRDCTTSCRQIRQRHEFIHFVVFLFCVLVLVSSIAYTSWGAFSPSELAINFRLSPLAELTYSVYFIIDALCILVIVVEFKVGIWPLLKKWWNSNLSVVVLDKNHVPICSEQLRVVEEASQSLLESEEEEGDEEDGTTEEDDTTEEDETQGERESGEPTAQVQKWWERLLSLKTADATESGAVNDVERQNVPQNHENGDTNVSQERRLEVEATA